MGVPHNSVFANDSNWTYSASALALVPAASATDVVTLTGVVGRIIRLQRMFLSATATAGTQILFQLIKRSTLDTGGTATNPTRVPYASTNPTVQAVMAAYTANPAGLGASIGTFWGSLLLVPATASAAATNGYMIDFSTPRFGQAPMLLSATEQIALNLNAVTIGGGLLNVTLEWAEY